MLQRGISRFVRPALFATAAAALLGFGLRGLPSSAEDARLVPAPAADETPGQATTETAVLAGGCFWGVQGVFQHVEGVTSAVSGYAGGDSTTARYERVSSGSTGHAEAVRVTYDSHKISYGQLLQIYFSVAHNPTELNRQGPDSGTQYRSAIFPANPEQARLASAYVAQIGQSHVFPAPVVTRIEPDRTFYPAEAYHQDFLTQNPGYPYIVINDLPKIENLKRLFPGVYRANPVLVSAAKSQS
jgi:peptide-methionine (S)-S-oxide reductase